MGHGKGVKIKKHTRFVMLLASLAAISLLLRVEAKH